MLGITYIVGDCLYALCTARETASVCANILIGNTRIVEVATDDPVLDWVELELEDITNFGRSFSRCELVARLSKLS